MLTIVSQNAFSVFRLRHLCKYFFCEHLTHGGCYLFSALNDITSESARSGDNTQIDRGTPQ